MKEHTTDFAAFIGIDWADEKHDVYIVAANELVPDEHSLDHKHEAIDDWAAKLRERFGGRPVAVCLEQARGALPAS